MPDFSYPAARRDSVVDQHHGISVPDPFRWLEEGDAAETRAWIDTENALTQNYLAQSPARTRLHARLSELWDYEKFGLPQRKGNSYFWTHNDGLQNQAVLYVGEALDAAPRVLLDPNTLSTDGTVALSGYAVSQDGRYLAFGLSSAGSDWQEWHVRDVASATDLPDRLQWVKFSGAAWRPDGTGFYYSRYDAPQSGDELLQANYYQKLYFHALGTTQADDVLVYERPDQKEWGFNGNVTEDGSYLIISVWHGTQPKNRVFYQSLMESAQTTVELLPDADAGYHFVGNDGPRVLVLDRS